MSLAGDEEAAPRPLTPERGAGILRRETAERRKAPRQVRFHVDEEGVSRPLAAPRTHSSAAMRTEVRREAQQEFDARSAVRTELRQSSTARRGVERETSKALNVCRVQSLYRGLVSVDPPVEQMLTARQRRAEHREAPPTEGPDISAFSNPCERYTETPYLKVDGLPPLTLQPRVRPPHTAFDMFHKLEEWMS